MNQHQNKTFIELGPWLRGLSYLEHEDLDEGKQFIAPNNVHLHKRTFLKLPRVTQTLRNSTKKSKNVLKMSHQSLDLDDTTIQLTNPKSRYGALNGSLVPKPKPAPTGRSLQLARQDSHTIDTASLERKVSTVQMGDPVIGHRVLRGKGKRLMNEECAKKRGLMQFIRQVSHNKDFMHFYLEHRRERAYSHRPEL